MIVVENKRKKESTLLKLYSHAVLADVTSTSPSEALRRLSPFFPHGGIPVPFSDGVTASCVEAVWQGLKVFESCGIDTALFQNYSMKGIKRTSRRFGRTLGHQKGVYGTELLGYVEARKLIYLPTYRWMLEHKAADIIERLRDAAQKQTIVLLDYDTNADIYNTAKPLSHASLVKAYAEGSFPYDDIPYTPKTTEGTQLSLFDS